MKNDTLFSIVAALLVVLVLCFGFGSGASYGRFAERHTLLELGISEYIPCGKFNQETKYQIKSNVVEFAAKNK